MIMTKMLFRNCILKFVGVLLAVLQFTSVDAQIILRQLSVNEGLSNYQVSDILQDDYGFIWIPTNDGLNRYDGAGCKTYLHNLDETGSLSSNRIKSLYYDQGKNRLLVGTDGGGINAYDYASDSFKAYYIRNSNNDWLPENDIIDIQPENDGCLWIATRRFIFLVGIEEDIVVKQAIPYPTNRVLNSLFSTDTELFAFAKRRVICYKAGVGEYTKGDELVLSDDITINSVSRISEYRFLISTDNGIAVMSVSYTLAAQGTFKDTEADLNDALDYIRAHASEWNVDASSFGFYGFSAGGHLSAYMDMTTPEARLFISSAGPADMLVHGRSWFSKRSGLAEYFCVESEDSENLRKASPLYIIPDSPAKIPAAMIIHGLMDTIVDPEPCLEFALALEEHGAEVETLAVPYGIHGVVNPRFYRYEEFMYDMLYFARKHLK